MVAPVPSNIIGAFSEEQASRLSGVSINQLRRWDRDKLFRPSFSDLQHVPYGRVYSFRDLVQLRVLNDLRNNKGVSLGHLHEVSKRLAHLGEERWIATTLYVLGKRVVYDDPRTNLRQEIVSGQRVFKIPLRVVIKSTRRAVLEMNSRRGKLGQVEKARFIAQNEPVVAGTRIPVATLNDYVRAGYPAAEIIREFPVLEEADIAAAVAYGSEHITA